MIIVDRALAERERAGTPIRVGMTGAGYMGRALARSIHSVPGMVVSAIANRTVANARRAYKELGLSPVVAGSVRDVQRAIAHGSPCVTEDPFLLTAAPGIDVICEVTGAVDYGARVTMSAIANGKHVVLMNAELDATLGPLLQVKAAAAGVVVTGCDGDQPGVLVNLWRFVRQLGCTPLVLGNIKGFQDVHRNPTTQEGFARKWGQNPYMVTSFADGTKISIEQATVANATGMTVARRGMLGWEFSGHVDQLAWQYDIAMLQELGGIVDYVIGAQPSPGVYCMATHDDPAQRRLLQYYKLGDGPLYSFYTPYHLCHFEVPASIARAVLFADAAVAADGAPRVEAITLAKRSLPAGHVLDGLGGYDTYAQAERAGVARAQRLLPVGVAGGCRLRKPAVADEVITYRDVELPAGRLTDELRDEQERLFPDVAIPEDPRVTVS
jgi:predicted homoserine dehydrogenase-like protein